MGSMRQASSDADLLLEGGVQKISRKVGDISDMLKQTQYDMHASVEVAAVITAGPLSLAQKTAGESQDLSKSVDALKAATQQTDAAFIEGLKTMTASFDKIEKVLVAGTKSIADRLDVSQN